jgi:hypothetical protein
LGGAEKAESTKARGGGITPKLCPMERVEMEMGTDKNRNGRLGKQDSKIHMGTPNPQHRQWWTAGRARNVASHYGIGFAVAGRKGDLERSSMSWTVGKGRASTRGGGGGRIDFAAIASESYQSAHSAADELAPF